MNEEEEVPILIVAILASDKKAYTISELQRIKHFDLLKIPPPSLPLFFLIYFIVQTKNTNSKTNSMS